MRLLIAQPITRREILVQTVRGDVETVVAVGGVLEFTAAQNLNAVVMHDPNAAVLTALETQCLQFLHHARTAIPAQTEPMLLANMGQKDHVSALTG